MAKNKAVSKRRVQSRKAKQAPDVTTLTHEAEPETPALELTPPKHFPIVGIGASAGGLAAFEAFLSAIPFSLGSGMAFVLVQHLSPDHKSLLTELVRRYTRLQVHEVEDGMEVKPNRVYIIPPNHHMALLAGKLHLFTPPAERGSRLSIDFFFRSLAADQREHAICIVLSGTGSDGSLGLRAVKAEGGMAMAQSPETTEFDGMPRSAIATGLVDYVLPPSEMPARLIAYASQVFSRKPRLPQPSPVHSQDVLAKICVLLRAQTSHDFSQYKENTITRRVQRRMALHQLENAGDYLRYMQNNADETAALFRELLIGVTSFFRDPEAFESLQNTGIPRLFDGVPPGGPVRAWVCGCSTGEEAYSIAILIQEHLEKLQQPFRVQIFATDIDRHATDQARTGIFPQSISTDVSPERLARYFTEDANGFYRIRKVIRDLLIFSEQNVLKDPPFSRLGLISCRNLFIYLKGDLQRRLLSLFHYSLKPDGVLFLGSSETVADHNGRFEVLDRKAKTFLRKGDVGSESRFSVSQTLTSSLPVAAPLSEARGQYDLKLNLRNITEQTLLRHSGQAGVVVKENGDILYFHGRTGNYLEPSPGEATSNVLRMAREGLRPELKAALSRASLQSEPVHSRGVQVKADEHFRTVDLTIIPILTAVPHLFLVIFEERQPAEPLPLDTSALATYAPEAADHIEALEKQLRAKDEYLQNVTEEMETSGEELRSSNEEMQSINEELQSTNEELETSKEELQSVNEELATVNAELQKKVSDLSRANDDMNNLLAGTGIVTLFVDHHLCITRFTPSITKLIYLIPSDIGRPLAHTVSTFLNYEHLIEDVKSVLDTLVPVEEEVQTKAGSWYLLGVRPYRTLENVIEGAVITFVDITARKVAEQKLKESERFRLATEVDTLGMVFFRLDGVITYANDAFLRMFAYDRASAEAGTLAWDKIVPAEEMPPFLNALKNLKIAGYTGHSRHALLCGDGSRRASIFTAMRTSESEAIGYFIDASENALTALAGNGSGLPSV
jgi:two-component system CheB/CheR fusion protein